MATDLRPFGPLTDHVPAIGQGTWKMEADGKRAAEALVRGLDLGLTHVDTAELYGSGKVESLVGDVIRGRRAEVFLVSKVMPSHATFEGTLSACEASLRRLGTDHLDVYLLHWPGSVPLERTIAAFERLVQDGKIRAWGVSNFDEEELDAALQVAGPGKIACNQVLYHLEERAIEHAVLPWCEANGVAVVGYSPFGDGFVSGARLARLEEIARAHGNGVTARQVALAFLVRRPSLFAIPKASRVLHVEENAGATGLVLSEDELLRIDEAFPCGKRRRGVPTA